MRIPSIRLLFPFALLAVAVNALSQEPSALARTLTFHASFDSGVDADHARGDRRIYTAPSYRKMDEARVGLHHPDVSVTSGRGRFGNALEFRKKNTLAIFYKAQDNIDFQTGNWSGAVSFWLSLDPDQDLEPGYCDPIQLTDSDYNDSALWVDFSKDERPRHFRLGVFGDLAAWNPERIGPDQNPAFKKRLLTVTRPPFGRGRWTHVVITHQDLNGNGVAKLYLNGQLQGTTESIREPFTWDLSRAAVRLGLNYVGLYDELAAFNRALDENEVRQLYSLAQGVASLHK